MKKAFSGGALLLTRMDGDDLPRPVNSDSVKKILCMMVSSNQINKVLARKFSLHYTSPKNPCMISMAQQFDLSNFFTGEPILLK